jgi:hypothetical protein
VFSARDFLRRSIFSCRTPSVMLAKLSLHLIGPVADLPDSFRMDETLAARNSRHSDAKVDGTICRIMARFFRKGWSLIQTG